MSYLIAPYAALSHGVDEAGKDELYRILRESALVSGFELPFRAPWTREEAVKAAHRIGPDRDVVLTTMPGLVGRASRDPRFGPASTDPEGRKASVQFVKEAWRAATLLGDLIGPDRVKGVTIASAPKALPGASSPHALAESLDAMLTRPWGATRLIVEHCDALIPEHPAAKGFLPLEEELDAVLAINRSHPGSVAITINWGRSVIETRDPALVPPQVRTAATSGVLFGLMFSGSSDSETEYGAAWADSHLPPADESGATHGTGSLLTKAEMRRSIAELGKGNGDTTTIGLKVTAPLGADLSLRASILMNSLSLLAEAEREADLPSREAL